jgi:predicted nucleic acid-binding protein
MIHFDTNVLVAASNRDRALESRLEGWLGAGETFATSAIAWSEFLCGPILDGQIQATRELIESRVVPFDTAEAVLAADLFNRTGRSRGRRMDCLIAATAICAGAAFATENRRDFQPYVAAGLRLL